MPSAEIISLNRHRAREYMRRMSVAEVREHSLPHIHPHRLAQATRDDGMMAALADDRPDLAEQLRSVPDEPLVSWPAKVLVAAVWVVCCAYCAAIWCGWAN